MNISNLFSFFSSSSASPTFFSKYPLQNDKTKIVTQRVFDSQRYQTINRDPAYRIFREYEIVNILQHQSLLEADNEKAFLLLCRELKALGDFVFHLIASGMNTHSEFGAIIQQIVGMKEYLLQILPFLKEYQEKKCSLEQLSQNLKKIKEELDKKEEKDLEKLFEEFSTAEFSLSKEELSSIFERYRKLYEIEKENSNLQELLRKSKEIRKRSRATPEEELFILAIGRKMMKSKYGIYPYNTQMLATLGLLHYPDHLKGRIAQVYTGEGKSTIIALLALVQAFRGKTVDIVSSSRYLAKRDAEKYACFFREFEIEVSHVCEDRQTKDHFRGQILYGTNFDFEFAWMRDQSSEEKKRVNGNGQSRPFEVVIVDEVDNLLIDSALHAARIGIPSLVKTSWVYEPIFHFMQELAIVLAGFGLSPLTSLRKHLSNIENGRYREDLSAIANEQLKRWMGAAHFALHSLQENRQYLVKRMRQKKEEKEKKDKEIVIVDWSNTGRLKEQSRWQSGIHEFLEIKHKISVKEENLTACSLSHPTYFNAYQTICGLTGTIGSERERKEVEQTYLIDSFAVPSHRERVRELLEPIFTTSKENHYTKLVEEIQEIQGRGRPILLLCETIQDTIDFSQHLTEKEIPHQLLNEAQGKEEDLSLAVAGHPKMVTIATNTAGRGTDILVHRASLARGGLHVVFAFFPANQRVEAQGFGRAGRQGQKGSGRLILQNDKGLPLLVEEREKSVATTSSDRMERVAVEKKYHEFLQLFWQKLQEFYKKPLTDRGIDQSLSQIAEDCRKFPSLKLIEELLKKLKNPSLSAGDRDSLHKTMKASLGLLSQQYWAHFFYGPLGYLENQEQMKLLHENHRSKWEGIFHIQ